MPYLFSMLTYHYFP